MRKTNDMLLLALLLGNGAGDGGADAACDI